MIVLDTHAWIWWVAEPGKLSAEALTTINYSEAIGICPISCWEISMKVTKGRLSIDRDVRLWIKQALHRRGVKLLDLSAEIAVSAGQLDQESFHGDPADRLIVATSMHHGAALITKDQRIRGLPGVRTVW